MKIKKTIPIKLTVDHLGFSISGNLEVAISVKQDVVQMALANGYDPEGIGNLMDQKLAAVNTETLASILEEI